MGFTAVTCGQLITHLPDQTVLRRGRNPIALSYPNTFSPLPIRDGKEKYIPRIQDMEPS